MNTFHTEILGTDTPVDVYAENALRGQHLALIEDDQGHVTSPMQGSPNLTYIRGSASRVWQDAIYTATEGIIAIIPVKITPDIATMTVSLAGSMASQAVTQLSLSFKAYFASRPDVVDEFTLTWDTDPQIVALTLSNPRPGQTYNDQLIVTMRNILPTDETVIGAAAHQVFSSVQILTNVSIYESTLSAPPPTQSGPDNVLYIIEHGYFDVGNNDDAAINGQVYDAYPTTNEGGSLLAITGWKPRAISLNIEGVDGGDNVQAQPELFANISVEGQVHQRHSLIIDRARDHRRYLSIRPSGDVLVGAELSQRTPFRRADGLVSGVLLRDSIYLDRGARGVLSLNLCVLCVLGDGVLKTNANPAEPDAVVTQDMTVRLLQFESGTSPTVISTTTVPMTFKAWRPRSMATNHRILADARRWQFSGGRARLEETSRISGAGFRWGTLAIFELALLNLPRFDLALEGLTFDADLPLIVEVEAVTWQLGLRDVLYSVAGSIVWEGS